MFQTAAQESTPLLAFGLLMLVLGRLCAAFSARRRAHERPGKVFSEMFSGWLALTRSQFQVLRRRTIWYKKALTSWLM